MSLSYKICPLFTYSICYWEVCIHFLDGGGIFCWWDSSKGVIFHVEGSIQGVSFSGEILRWGNLPGLLYDIRLMSFLLFADSISRMVMLRGVVQGKFSPGFNCLENKSLGRKDFFAEVQSDFLVSFKKRSENKWEKQVFFNWKWAATLKLKTNGNYYVYEGDCPLLTHGGVIYPWGGYFSMEVGPSFPGNT